MRKLKLQVQTSIDGFIADKDDGMGWITWTPDNGFIKYVTELTGTVDTMLLGRKLAQGFIPYWTDITTRPDDEQYFFAKIMVDMPKIVFTKTLNDTADWQNTTLAKGDLTGEVNKLKSGEGKDIIVYGGGSFVSALIKAGLIDEYHLFVNPAILGKGMPIYQALENTTLLKLVKTQALDNGIVLLNYVK